MDKLKKAIQLVEQGKFLEAKGIFEDLVKDTKNLAIKISKILGIDFSKSMLVPTTLGIPNKGNSSFGKDDTNIGKIYSSSTDKQFPKEVILPKDDLHEPILILFHLFVTLNFNCL